MMPRADAAAVGSALRDEHAAQIAENLFGTELPQTVQMPERTLALETGTAFEMQPLYLREVRQGRRVARVGRTVHGDERPAQRGCHVHQPRVVADHGVRARYQRA